MGRIDLQLFAMKLNTGTSIVDYMKSKGQDSSYKNRKKLANQYGIKNYTGAEDQNIELMKLVKNADSKSAAKNSTSAANNTASAGSKASNAVKANVAPVNTGVKNVAKNVANTATGNNSNASDVVQEAQAVVAEQAGPVAIDATTAEVVQPVAPGAVQATETAKPTFTATAAPTYTPQQYTTPTFNQVQAPTYTGAITQANQAATMDQRLPADTLAALNSQFQVSQAYQQAMDYTNGLLQQLNTGKTTYSNQINQLINDYKNREKFSYNADNDPMFQQALASAMKSGQTAMQDTMGQAAALTGGYGSSYATNVGQNAYNQYVQEAYNMLPEYYQLAMEAYNQEGQNMLNQLSMMDNADSKEYDRLNNAYNMNYNSAQNMYNQEYGAWQDSVNNAYNYAGLLNSDYWNKMDYDESTRQYDQNFGYQQYQDALSQSNWQNQFGYQQYQDQVAQNQWQTEFDYQQYLDSLGQSNWQNEFDYNQYQDAIDQGNVEWEQGFKESEANRDQGNIEWDQSFKQNEANRDQSNIEWEQNFTQSEADRDQGNVDWEHGFKESEADRDQGNIEWEQKFTQSEANRDQSNWEKEYSEEKRQFDTSFGEDQRQFNESLGEDKRQFNESLGEDKRQFDETMDFKESEVIRDQRNADREYAYKEEAAKAAAQAETKLTEPEDGYASLTDTNLNNAKEVFLQAGGGEAGYAAVDQYLTAIGKNNVDNENLITMLDGLEIPIQYQGWTIEKDTKNWLGGNDNNDTYTYNGETLTYKELKKRIEKSDLSDSEKDKLLEKLKAQSKK